MSNFQQLELLNQQILKSAKLSDWSGVKTHTEKRHQLVTSLTTEAHQAQDIDLAKKIHRVIKQTDEQLMKAIKLAKSASIQENLDLKSSQTALQAYQNTKNHTATS
ncbi:hypothetical protein ACUR5C_11140 [Aliikangiella sp. IMCC44653]